MVNATKRIQKQIIKFVSGFSEVVYSALIINGVLLQKNLRQLHYS